MNQNPLKITDVITGKYADFLDYCAACKKVYVSELTDTDYAVFRVSMGKTLAYIQAIQNQIEYAVKALNDNEDNEQINTDVPAEIMLLQPELRAFSCICDVKPDDKSIAALLGAEASGFSQFSIDLLALSVRAKNCLYRARYKTIGDVLELTTEKLMSIRNLGIKTANEVIEKLTKFISDGSPAADDRPAADETSVTEKAYRSRENVCIISNEKIKNAIEAILLEDDYSAESMTNAQTEQLASIKAAADVLGNEICLEAYLNPHYVTQICDMLSEFSMPFIQRMQAKNEAAGLIGSLPDSVKKRKAVPFINMYKAKGVNQLPFLLSLCNENTAIGQIPLLYETVSQTEDLAILKTETTAFLNWLNFDTDTVIADTFENIKEFFSSHETRCMEIFLYRAAGKTLEEIGNIYNVTRERIRQLESKAHRIFRRVYSKQKYDLIMLAYALRDGDNILYYNEIEEILGRFAKILWECIRHSPKHRFYYYSKALNAVIIRPDKSLFPNEKDLLSKVDKAIKLLPEMIEAAKKGDLLFSLASENSIPIEILEKEFQNTYKQSGIFYYKGRLSVVFRCSYVLKHRFPAGFKIADDFEAAGFKQYLEEFFGIENANITNRALDAKIGIVGVLCDRGKYIHPDLLNIEQSIIDAINEYIENSAHAIVPYEEIYQELKGIFDGTQITNRYILQGTLQKYGCSYSMRRDYIHKEQSVSFVDEFDAFVEKCGIVHKDEIFAEFPSLNDAQLGQTVARSSNVFNIENGCYIHASQFNIQPDDYEPLREYLKDICRNTPVHIRSVTEAFEIKFPEFMARNNFNNSNELFAALTYMFKDEFAFSRPYISKIGTGEATNKSVILQHIEDYSSIEIEDLVSICEENKIRYSSIPYLLQALSPEYLRIGRTTLMKREYTGITDEIIEKTVKIITEALQTSDYIVGSEINDFLWFPQIDIAWNEFLLESLITGSGAVNIIRLRRNPAKHANVVYVSEKYKDAAFEGFIVRILSEEVQKGTFLSKVEMYNWLKEHGFIEDKLPNFLESAKYFHVDNTGVHCTGK